MTKEEADKRAILDATKTKKDMFKGLEMKIGKQNARKLLLMAVGHHQTIVEYISTNVRRVSTKITDGKNDAKHTKEDVVQHISRNYLCDEVSDKIFRVFNKVWLERSGF